jgi:hypothetical protein
MFLAYFYWHAGFFPVACDLDDWSRLWRAISWRCHPGCLIVLGDIAIKRVPSTRFRQRFQVALMYEAFLRRPQAGRRLMKRYRQIAVDCCNQSRRAQSSSLKHTQKTIHTIRVLIQWRMAAEMCWWWTVWVFIKLDWVKKAWKRRDTYRHSYLWSVCIIHLHPPHIHWKKKQNGKSDKDISHKCFGK